MALNCSGVSSYGSKSQRGIGYQFWSSDKRFKDLNPLNNLSTSG